MRDNPLRDLEKLFERTVHMDRLIPGLSSLLESNSLRILNLGCGMRPITGAINLDICRLPDLSAVADIRESLPFRSDAFDAVVAWSVLEHLYPDQLHCVLREIARVSRDGAILKVHVPYFSSEAAFSTIDHKAFFAYNTFWRYREGDIDPTTPKLFSGVRVMLVWHTNRLLRIPNAIIMRLINAHPLIALFYQHFFCWIFPMRAVDVVCRVGKSDNGGSSS